MNVANLLTIVRIALIPIVGYLFSRAAFDTAALLFLAACFTDIIDGWIARHFGAITDFGKIMDPLADKGMQLTVLVSLAFCGRMPRAAVYVILAKEFLMCLGGCLLYKKNIVVAANWWGKAATVVIAACVLAVLIFYQRMTPTILFIVQWLPVVAAVGAFIGYFIGFIKRVREGKVT